MIIVRSTHISRCILKHNIRSFKILLGKSDDIHSGGFFQELNKMPTESHDIFISSDLDDSNSLTFQNEEFACTIQTVRMHPTSADTAIITEEDSDWILPTWTDSYSGSSTTEQVDVSRNVLKEVEVGDIVRIGDLQTWAHTDPVTVLEVKYIKVLVNTATSAVALNYDPNGANPLLPQGGGMTIPSTGIAHIALRVSARVQCTTMPYNIPTNATIALVPDAQVMSTPATRNQVSAAITNASKDQKYFYPLFVSRKLHQNNLVTRFQNVYCNCQELQLCGYTVRNMRQFTSAQAYEQPEDDYMVLNILELQGTVQGNTRYTRDAFAVLPLSSGNNLANFNYEHGLARKQLHGAALRQLSIKVTDSNGAPLKYGRLHLWFKLLTHKS